jgi:hypothetical protein
MVVRKIKKLKTLMVNQIFKAHNPEECRLRWYLNTNGKKVNFFNNKLYPFGERKESVLQVDEHNTLLERLVQTVINLEISEDDKIKESPLLRLFLCYRATKQLKGESLGFLFG